MSISPEFRKTGRFCGRKMLRAPEKSNFSQTCNLLSQYLKEKRSFGDLSFGTCSSTPDLGKSAAMDLFPQHAGFGTEDVQNNTEIKLATKPKVTPITIIYGGKVVVYEFISDEKVKELIVLASNGNLEGKSPCSVSQTIDLNVVDNSTEECFQKPIQAHLSDLPIERRASLRHFLEKRKFRINARAPYLVPTSKPVETRSWLGL